MRVAYLKDEASRPGFPRYRAVLGFRDDANERIAVLATVRRGAVNGAIRWIVSWNPRFEISRSCDGFDRKTFREARAELEGALFVELVGYRHGDGIMRRVYDPNRKRKVG